MSLFNVSELLNLFYADNKPDNKELLFLDEDACWDKELDYLFSNCIS